MKATPQIGDVFQALFARVRRPIEHLIDLPLGRRFDPNREELGLMERWYAAQPTQRIVVALLELDAPLERDAVERAVRALCERHSNALGVCEERSRDAKSPRRPARLQVRPLTAADPVPWFDSTEADGWTLAAAMLHRPFEAGAALFRIALTRDGRQIVCGFDHLIADGVSIGLFAAELGSLLAGRELSAAPDPSASLPLDARMDLRPSLRVLARTIRASSKDLMLTPFGASPTRSQLRTHLLPLRVPRSVVDALLARARERSLSMHAVLSAAALLAARDVLDARGSKLRLMTPVSLREQCQPRPTGIGLFFASIDTDLEVSTTDDTWAVAKRCMRDLASKKSAAARNVGLLALAGDLHALANKYEQTSHGRTATVEVSNIGRITGVPANVALWLTQGAHYHAALFVLTVATSDGDGELHCCLSYPEPLVGRDRATRFLHSFERRLLDVSSRPDSRRDRGDFTDGGAQDRP